MNQNDHKKKIDVDTALGLIVDEFDEKKNEEVGFEREEFHSTDLAGQAKTPKMHVFVLYQDMQSWPEKFEDIPKDHLGDPKYDNPVNALEESLTRMKKAGPEGTALNTALASESIANISSFRVTAAQAMSANDSEGDVLVFPDRIRVKKAATSVEQAQSFAEKYFSGEFERQGMCEPLEGPQIFVCAHINRDQRCGFCGTILIRSLSTEIASRQKTYSSTSDAASDDSVTKRINQIELRPCSHIGGHKFAGNVLIYRECSKQKSVGDWLSYVSPSNVKDLIDFAIESPLAGNGVIPPIRLWRGRDGISEDLHKSQCKSCSETSQDQSSEYIAEMEDFFIPKKDGTKSNATNRSSSNDIPKVIFVLGGPGAGKGTQCSLLQDRFDFLHLSAGDLLRAERENPESQYGSLIENYIAEGKIVPVEITVGLLFKEMKSSGRKYFLIDGFPRNEDNWSGWQRVVGDAADVQGVLFFDCPEEVMQDRLLERGKSSGRTDDNIESIRKRFRTYQDSTRPIIDLFKEKNAMWRVIADRPVEEVFDEVESIIPQMIPGLKPLRLQSKENSFMKNTINANKIVAGTMGQVSSIISKTRNSSALLKLALVGAGAALVLGIGFQRYRRYQMQQE